MRTLRLITLTICLSASPVLTWPQESVPGAPVEVDGQTLFMVWAAVGSFTPAERAAAVNQRLDNILKSQPEKIEARVEQTDIGWMISVGHQPVIAVTERDAQSEGLSNQALAERWANAIQEGLRQAESERIMKSLWRRISVSLLVIVAALGLLSGLRRAWRRVIKALEAWRERVPQVRPRGLRILSGKNLFSALRRALAAVFFVALVLVASAALSLVFSQFPATRGYARDVFRWIWTPVIDILQGFVHYVPNLFYILVIVVVARLVIRLLGFLFEQVHRGVFSLEPWLHRDVARPTSQIIRAILIVLALFFIAPLIPGTGSTAAEAISVVLGLMVSFGSTATVGNVIAGVVLTYMRPYRLRDRVKLGDTVGDVVERTFLYTKVLTIKNEEVIVPSLQALGGAMVNYSARAKQEGLILHTSVTIGYDVPWRKVHELLIGAAQRTAGVLKEPGPYVLQTSLDDWYASYQLNAYTEEPSRMSAIYSELHQNIQDCFNEAGVEITSPHYYQLRDGNAVTIPADYLKNYKPPRFLIDARVAEKRG